MLAKCLAAVAEWVGRAPRIDTPALHPMSAMVESGGSPLVRRVGRILGGRTAPRARTARVAIAASVGVLAALAGVAPRVSVVHAATAGQRFTLLRAVVEANGRVVGHDTMLLLRTGASRIAIDTLIRQRRGAAVPLDRRIQ